MKAGPFGKLSPPVMEKLLQLGRQPKDMVALAHSMGVKIALGTDSAVSPHGENANEFIEYVNAGMTPMQALMAGTVNAAEAGGISDLTGALQPGKAADLVALAANPLEDIQAVLDVQPGNARRHRVQAPGAIDMTLVSRMRAAALLISLAAASTAGAQNLLIENVTLA